MALRSRQKQIYIEDLGMQGATLELHPHTGHPIARLLPTVKNSTAGAAPEENFVGEAAATIEEDIETACESVRSDFGEVRCVNLKNGVRRRLLGLTSAAVKDLPQKAKHRFKILQVLT